MHTYVGRLGATKKVIIAPYIHNLGGAASRRTYCGGPRSPTGGTPNSKGWMIH